MNKKNIEKPKNKGGRPKKEINLKQVEAIAAMQATYPELAAALDISVSTVEKKMAQQHSGFYGAYKKGKEKGKVSLRRLQWKAAQGITYYAYLCDKRKIYMLEDKCDEFKSRGKAGCRDCQGARLAELTDFKGGATGMQIWLGKQWLGQADKQEIGGKDGGPLALALTMSEGIKQIRDQMKSNPEEEERLLGEVADERD